MTHSLSQLLLLVEKKKIVINKRSEVLTEFS